MMEGFSYHKLFAQIFEPALRIYNATGVMQMDNGQQVQAFYDKAIALGASDQGAPDQRIDNFYAGYFGDPDGNTFNAFCFNEVTV